MREEAKGCESMRKFIMISAISTLIFAVSCTRIPISEETGVGPGEYEGIVNTGEIKKENESLKEELDETKTKLEVLEEEYLSLAKSNENIIFKLEEAESKLDIVKSEDIPKFNTESTDKNSIVSYLNDSSKLIVDSIKGIEIIDTDEVIVFRTLGYGDDYSQIFIWDEGENEPVLIDGASFGKDGSYEWLGEYILIKNPGGKNKVLNVKNEKITGTFDDPAKFQLLDGTTTILLKDTDNKFVLYDFVNDSSKKITLDNSKYTDFNLQNNFVVFTGDYVGDDGVEYEIRASLSLDKLKEVYGIGSGEVETPDIGDTVNQPETEAEEDTV